METKEILLSFCIPTYKRKKIVIECIKEIQKIQDERIEIVVCDNHSEDGTKEAILELKENDNRIIYIENKENIGFAKNVFKVQKEAQGKYIFVLSDEDIINFEFINKLLKENILKNEKYDVIFGSIYHLDLKKYNAKYKDSNDYLKNLHKIVSSWYLSGVILKREKLNFDSPYNIDDRNLYPHLTLRMGMGGDIKIKCFSDIICFIRETNINGITKHQQIIENKKATNYYTYEARIVQVKFWNEFLEKEIKDKNYRKKLYKIFSKLFAMVYMGKYIKRDKRYYNEIIRIKGFKNYFVFYSCIYSIEIFIKSFLKKILPSEVIDYLKRLLMKE